MRKLIVACFALILVVAANGVALAQTETASGAEMEKDLALLRRNLRSEKKQIIAMNLSLTDAEATKFWPVYDQYAAEMSKHYDEFYAVIKDYAANQKTLTDAQALSMIKRWSAIQVDTAKTRQKYVDLIEKALPGRKAALFFQVDRRLYALIDLQIASEIPLVVQQQ
ncbi:MAG TPA: hypothetical protein VFZ22_08090 [Pyrinomonadaceae bacterium]|nr:hypothetical protein [Pyrinomonadaceae bacterium]